MANLEAQAAWESVRQLETDELARGGLNGNMNEQARSLLARTEYLNEKKAEKSDIAQGQYRFSTLAAFNAVKASIPANSTVVIDEAGVNQGANTWDGLTLTKSDYDPLTQAKNYVDENPNFKKQKIVAGNDFNTFFKQGTYYHWGANLTAAQVANAPFLVSGNIPFGTLNVINTLDTDTSACTQIFYSMYDGFPPYYRKKKQDGSWPTTWDSYTLDSKKSNTTAMSSGQDVLTLLQGRYNIPSLTIGNSLLNMPNATYKLGTIEVDIFAGYRIVKFTPYGRDTSMYINSSFEAEAWSGWQQYTPNTASQINALLKALTKTDYFGKKFTGAELSGTAVYTAAYYVGFNSITGIGGASFNAVKARLYNSQGGEIQYRIYTGSAVSSGSFGYSVSAANQANYMTKGICKSFPNFDSGDAQTIELDQAINIPPNTPFVIVFRRTDLRTFGVAQHTAVSGNLESRGFNLIATAVDWGVSNLSNGSTPAYTQAGFQLLLNIEANESPTAPEVDTYIPELVLPPVIYALEGLQGHIYLEHLLVENYKQYDFDITCTKGSHRNRGFLWQPNDTDAAGDYPITITIHDKQKGLQLTSLSSSIKLANKTAKSGNLNVCVIGDSLVQAGTITQRLLDISTMDVTKVQLIGTRGTGANKHEGRGGWTINDYTTAGRTYYLFSVSGMSTSPAINATTYSYGGGEFTVQEANITGGNGTLLCSYTGTAPTNGATGTLTKSNASAGDATIAFSNVQSQSGNPFWNGTSVDYQNYLTVNSLSVPDIVFIQLGVNDTFGLTSDGAVDNLTTTAFPKLDQLITSIKSANSAVKIGVCSPPSYADQDAFGINYACGQTAWRAKRNIVRFNKNLFAYYKAKEASNIFVVGSGINVDAENNFPAGSAQVNSHNTNLITVQTNAVHPADSGYKQIADYMFAAIKAI